VESKLARVGSGIQESSVGGYTPIQRILVQQGRGAYTLGYCSTDQPETSLLLASRLLESSYQRPYRSPLQSC